MDGVLIFSEPYWQIAEREIFKKHFDIDLTAHDVHLTTGLKTTEVVKLHSQNYHLQIEDVEALGHLIEQRVIEQVKEQGVPMPGLYELFEWLNHQSIITYLVTSSSHYVLREIVSFLKLEQQFVRCFSAYDCSLGKPSPEVYLQAYSALTIPKEQVLVIEDSLNGLKAAKAAGFTAWNIPEPKNIGNPSFAIADRVFLSHHHILDALKALS